MEQNKNTEKKVEVQKMLPLELSKMVQFENSKRRYKEDI